MSPTSRRIFAYWLLLLLPTVGVGVAAVFLLRREQERLEERASYADEARKAAVTARTRLIAENVELLVGDVQTGLLDQLAEGPAGELDALLDQLEKSNPLVRAVFRCDAGGRIVRPGAATADEEGRAFLRRFAPTLTGSPPWELHEKRAKEQTALADLPQALAPAAESRARQEVAYNVAKVQQARRDTRELASKNSSYSAPSTARSSSYSSASAPAAAKDAERQQGALGAAADEKLKLDAVSEQLAKKTEAIIPGRRGWLPVVLDRRLHLLGWVQPAGAREVSGLELEMAALVSRLGGAMPEELSGDVGYALRDDQGRILHQAGAIPREWTSSFRESRSTEPAIRIPLAADLLPGWDVVAFVPTAPGKIQLGGGFLAVGTLLVGIFLVAIVTGGWLLLRQARQSEAEAAQKTSFVANVSHEFKTPLTTIRLYSELLEQGRVKDAAQGGEYLRTIGRETERLARLVGNALDFSRLEQGKKKYARDALDLRAEVTRLLDTQLPRLAEAGVVLQRELPEAPLPVTSDRDAIEQIVLNLIDNAAKYGAAGGEVTVQLAAKPAGGAIVRVLDRGPGVPREHWEKIFDKFHRADDTLTAEKNGTGLGLSIARQLARGLGGELRHVPRDGGGASFILELP